MSHDLFEAAKAAMAKAYAPYSKFPVGAALRTEDGRVFAGANIEVASYPEGWCAETTALGHYIMGGAMSHDLFEAAKAAMAKAYAPYSKFPVGAALRTEDGRVFAGANIEVASYPEGWCAETTALGHYIMGGGGKITEIAVIAERMAKCSPCGGCRQRLAEFCRPETRLYLCDNGGVVETVTMGEMLPYGFQGDMLK
ncbi:cytidine deaminase [Mesorhizobium mediterraneum]|uniref:cytidine deaminase n=1 Tax=Mesorhizobium mediterraneum TaxID=43617 RepID=UPI00177C3F1C